MLAQRVQNQGLRQLVFPRFYRGTMELLSDAGCFFDTLRLDEVSESCHVLPEPSALLRSVVPARPKTTPLACLIQTRLARHEKSRKRHEETNTMKRKSLRNWVFKSCSSQNVLRAFQGLIEGLGCEAHSNRPRKAVSNIAWSLCEKVNPSFPAKAGHGLSTTHVFPYFVLFRHFS